MAGTTSRIPVGATVLLGYHSPFRVAERFKVLEALFPHRVELLIGRGGPLKAEYADVLAPRSGLDECEEDGVRRAQSLRDFLVGRPLPVPPPVASEPAVWVLSGTGMSARIAAAARSRLSLALFFRSAPKPEWVHEYRTRMHALDCEPLVNMAVAGVCASTSEEAHRLLHLGISERRLGFEARVVGSPCECRTAIEELACAYGVSEVMFLDMSPSIETRVRSLEHLAGALA
jgi:alkanesulfonate monooxygenase SsuD/methylene tetrahydromethanopterin reductase-like flavin-dependent oxidoreductase (luciferase family)